MSTICKLFEYSLRKDGNNFAIYKNEDKLGTILNGNLICKNIMNSIDKIKDVQILSHFIDLGIYLDSLNKKG